MKFNVALDAVVKSDLDAVVKSDSPLYARRKIWNEHNKVGYDPRTNMFYYTVSEGFWTNFEPSILDIDADDWEFWVNPNC